MDKLIAIPFGIAGPDERMATLLLMHSATECKLIDLSLIGTYCGLALIR